MPSTETLWLFAGSAMVLLVIPGPAVTYIIARSLSQGRRAGVTAALGTSSGIFIHSLGAVVGVSAILASSALAFDILKYAGAVYLILLGIRKLLERNDDSDEAPRVRSTRRIYVESLLVSVLNPKPALFVLAFFPQFVDRARGNTTQQLMVLGIVFTVLALLSDGTYAIIAGMGAAIRRRKGLARGGRYVAGSTYIALGVVAAVTGKRTR